MKPGIQTFLDVNTAHLTPSDVALLQDHKEMLEDGVASLIGTSVMHYQDGCIVSTMSLVSDNSADVIEAKIAAMKADGFSDEFIALAQYGAAEGGLLLRFDNDAPVLEAFPTFEPENGLSM
jgi:hypothetical protein